MTKDEDKFEKCRECKCINCNAQSFAQNCPCTEDPETCDGLYKECQIQW